MMLIIFDFVAGYVKWAINIVIKLFFVVIAALLIISVGSIAFDVNANDLFAGSSVWGVFKMYFQHLPHIGMFVEGLLQLIDAVQIKVPKMEVTIYEEVLRCCIYMIIIRCFNWTIQAVDRVFRRVLFTFGISMSSVGKKLSDGIVYIVSYAFAAGVAGLMYDGVARKVPINIACWIIAGCLILVPVMMLITGRKSILASFLELVGGGALDILQLVLIYFATMCLMIVNDAAGSGYISVGEDVLFTSLALAALALLAISFIRRMIEEVK